jgi:hypothetical protein
MNEMELYLDALGLLKKLQIENYNNKEEVLLENFLTRFLKKRIDILIRKDVLTEALTQDLVYLRCYKNYGEHKSLNLGCFTEDTFIIDIILKYVGNIPINIYCGADNFNVKLGCINLQQLKELMYTYDPLEL